MATFTLTIETDNAAFHPFDASDEQGNNAQTAHEVARILRAAADKVEERGLGDVEPLHDANGNRVGSYQHGVSITR